MRPQLALHARTHLCYDVQHPLVGQWIGDVQQAAVAVATPHLSIAGLHEEPFLQPLLVIVVLEGSACMRVRA